MLRIRVHTQIGGFCDLATNPLKRLLNNVIKGPNLIYKSLVWSEVDQSEVL